MKRAIRVAVVAAVLFGMVLAGSASPVAAGYCSGDDIDVANSGGNVVIDNDDDGHHGHYHGWHGHHYDYDDGLIDIL